MFTGLVKTMGEVVYLSEAEKGLQLGLALDDKFDFEYGDSISVNGVCLTAVDFDSFDSSDDFVESLAENDEDFDKHDYIFFFVIRETLQRTNLSWFLLGDKVNIEPSMRLADLVGGHLVSGHVDFTTKLIEQNGEDFWFEIESGYEKYFVEKGSVCINGVSLTVAKVDGSKFKVCLIPETLKATNLSDLADKKVNIEVDLIARYLEKLV